MHTTQQGTSQRFSEAMVHALTVLREMALRDFGMDQNSETVQLIDKALETGSRNALDELQRHVRQRAAEVRKQRGAVAHIHEHGPSIPCC
ncbi:MAG: hypothetical protein H7Y88_03625 [Phycisphaerales bacterium]|nr:hypothetical protein [Phycisphaerales bacterium]